MHFRGDLRLGGDIQFQPEGDRFAYVWLQTQDSKATGFSRLLFAMQPWYASSPASSMACRVATVADPVAVSRAWALDACSTPPIGPSRTAQGPPPGA